MNPERTIYAPVFKTKAIQLSNERDNIENWELKLLCFTNGERNMRNLEMEVFQ